MVNSTFPRHRNNQNAFLTTECGLSRLPQLEFLETAHIHYFVAVSELRHTLLTVISLRML